MVQKTVRSPAAHHLTRPDLLAAGWVLVCCPSPPAPSVRYIDRPVRWWLVEGPRGASRRVPVQVALHWLLQPHVPPECGRDVSHCARVVWFAKPDARCRTAP
eukprot:scaffold13969_cov125-Isochrysis_galbana.AAC.6